MSPAAKATRAVLWLLVVSVAAWVSWNINQKTGEAVWWPAPAVVVGFVAYLLGRRMSGGRGLRAQVQRDIANGEAEERVFEITSAIVFPEIEDEGAVVFFLSGERVYCLSGQRVSRVVRDDTMASQQVQEPDGLRPVESAHVSVRSGTMQTSQPSFDQRQQSSNHRTPRGTHVAPTTEPAGHHKIAARDWGTASTKAPRPHPVSGT